ncbi:lysophospholipid acyltransferase [Allomyces arbusculus]|nr:lysophospholipid acyltransferase [Allomyces arbusculus]
MPLGDSLVAAVSAAAHLPDDKVRCLLALLATYPLSIPLLVLHPRRTVQPDGSLSPAPAWATTLKYIYIVVVATVLTAFCFPDPHDWIHLLAGAIAMYGIMAIGATLNLGKSWVWTVWAAAMLHMSYSHLARQWADYASYKFDHTAPQMVMVLKLTALAWSVYDHSVLAKNPTAPLTPRQRAMAVPLPTPLEFLAYIFYFGGLFVGPAFDLRSFQRFITGDAYLDTPINQAALAKKKETPGAQVRIRPPHPWLAMLQCVATSALFMVLTVLLADRFAFSRLSTPTYLDGPVTIAVLATRFARLQISGFAARTQYYAIWKLAEGACIVAGLGYNGTTAQGHAQWNQVTNVRIWALETASSFKGIIDNWNMGTSTWLKECVYLRLTPPGTRPTFLTTMVTYTTSAFWHGFYPGYYLTFASGALITTAARGLRRAFRARVLATESTPLYAAYTFAGWVMSQGILNYVVAPFMVLSLADSIAIWKANYFLGHICVLTAIAVASIAAPKKLSRAAATANKKAPEPASFLNDGTTVPQLNLDLNNLPASPAQSRSGSGSPRRRRARRASLEASAEQPTEAAASKWPSPPASPTKGGAVELPAAVASTTM